MPQVTKDIDLVVNQLINNEIVAIPTETVYGLAASMMSTSAINKVFQAKKRPHTNPLIVHIKDKNEVLKYVKSCPEKAQILMEKFLKRGCSKNRNGSIYIIIYIVFFSKGLWNGSHLFYI